MTNKTLKILHIPFELKYKKKWFNNVNVFSPKFRSNTFDFFKYVLLMFYSRRCKRWHFSKKLWITL